MPRPWMAWTSPSSVSEARARRTVTRLTPNSSRSSRSVGSCSPGASSPRRDPALELLADAGGQLAEAAGCRGHRREGTRDDPGCVYCLMGGLLVLSVAPTISAGFRGRRPRGREADAQKALDRGGAPRPRCWPRPAPRRARSGPRWTPRSRCETDISGLPDTTLSVWTSEGGNRLEILKKLAKELRGGEPQRQGEVDGARLRLLPRADQARPELRGRSGRRASATSAGRSTVRSSRPACSARSTTTPRPTTGTPATPRSACASSSSARTAPSTARARSGERRTPPTSSAGSTTRTCSTTSTWSSRRPSPSSRRCSPRRRPPASSRSCSATRTRGPHGTCSTTWSTSTPRSTTSAASSTATRARPTRATGSRKPPRRWSSGRKAGYIREDVNAIAQADASAGFLKGEGLFFPAGSWEAAAMRDNIGFFLTPPIEEGETRGPPAPSATPGTSPRTATRCRPAAAFVDFTTNEAAAREFFASGDIAPLAVEDPELKEGQVLHGDLRRLDDGPRQRHPAAVPGVRDADLRRGQLPGAAADPGRPAVHRRRSRRDRGQPTRSSWRRTRADRARTPR